MFYKNKQKLRVTVAFKCVIVCDKMIYVFYFEFELHIDIINLIKTNKKFLKGDKMSIVILYFVCNKIDYFINYLNFRD